MKIKIKKLLKEIIHFCVRHLQKIGAGRYVVDQFLAAIMDTEYVVKNHNCELKFVIPNSLNYMRSDTFFTKEPETLEWIDSMHVGAVLWDIGANIGLYSCYAAEVKKSQVYAFEPSVFNLELLARNVYLNGHVEQVTIIPLPLSESISINTLNMTSMEMGGALSTFAQEFGDDGNSLDKVFEFTTLGLSMEDVIRFFNIPQPDFIKMDVDGIEHLILKGGVSVLDRVQGVLIEVNDDFSQQAEGVNRCLISAGLTLLEKRQSEMVSETARFGNTYNQIWQRVDAGA
jgi:FkbM family methyltransferase